MRLLWSNYRMEKSVHFGLPAAVKAHKTLALILPCLIPNWAGGWQKPWPLNANGLMHRWDVIHANSVTPFRYWMLMVACDFSLLPSVLGAGPLAALWY